jgi:hypothetical protein
LAKTRSRKATGPLSAYAEKARKDPVIVVRRGKPFAAVVAIRNVDEETVDLSTSRKFLEIIKRSRAWVKKEGAFSSWTKRNPHGDLQAILKAAGSKGNKGRYRD